MNVSSMPVAQKKYSGSSTWFSSLRFIVDVGPITYWKLTRLRKCIYQPSTTQALDDGGVGESLASLVCIALIYEKLRFSAVLPNR